MAIVLANADGTVYHRYGGRSDVSPMHMSTLIDVMQQGLETHRSHLSATTDPVSKQTIKVDQLVDQQLTGMLKPSLGCIHCHYVREAQQHAAVESGNWNPSQFWIWPSPKQIGLIMDQERQYLIQKVIPNSSADEAGFQDGDQIISLNGVRVLTKYDIQWILDQSTGEPTQIPFALQRTNKTLEGILRLDRAWKVGDPSDYHWRVRNVFTEHMIKSLPTPGFTGPQLPRLSSSEATFALKVQTVNQGSYLAGIRLGDIVLGANGKSDFNEVSEFYKWCELQRLSGKDIQLLLIRSGNPMNIRLSLEHLNYSKVDQAPKLDVGFIIQELPADHGLRVGHVSPLSAASKAGISIGDRILSVDGRSLGTFNEFQSFLNQKSPGDLLMLHLTRNGQPLQLGYHLPDKEAKKNEIARLSTAISEKGQIVTCTVTVKLPRGKHIYSMHCEGFGLPSSITFRGLGYRLINATTEPSPTMVNDGIEPMWIHENTITFEQKLEITDPDRFLIHLSLYAQICDDHHCYELTSSAYSDGSSPDFFEFIGNTDDFPKAFQKTDSNTPDRTTDY
ncbi:PDZ domain-containing protein [Verrucomicrobia bacterium]|nr:PDZ domain-containing protein [Verrucomicrobiota bacterium]MDA7652733.1 PDZ domain-containing protein [bacterium]